MASNGMNKQHWPLVKFGDVVKNVNSVAHDPISKGINKIVGLEHMDPENLHIRRWNTPENGTSFTRKFVPGQTLFGKRRAYQRKVAFAEFEGICSGDILTFEPRDSKVLLSELLPFICQTDAFFDYALGTSAGSLSPRTSWKALKDFEFPLPPIEKQKNIAKILWAADEAIECWEQVIKELESSKQAILIDHFGTSLRRNVPWPTQKLHEVASVQTGIAKGKKYSYLEDLVTLPYLRFANVKDGYFDLSEFKEINVRNDEVERYAVHAGDVLLTEGGDFDKLGRRAVWLGSIDPCLHQNHVFCARTNTEKF